MKKREYDETVIEPNWILLLEIYCSFDVSEQYEQSCIVIDESCFAGASPLGISFIPSDVQTSCRFELLKLIACETIGAKEVSRMANIAIQLTILFWCVLNMRR